MSDPKQSATNAADSRGNSITQIYRAPDMDGQFLMVGNLIGALIGRLYSSGTLDKAKDAEKVLRNDVDKLSDTGNHLIDKGNKDPYETNLDDLFKIIHDTARQGYCPNYQNIFNESVYTATVNARRQQKNLISFSNRYNINLPITTAVSIRSAQVTATTASYTKAAEQARQFMWEASLNYQYKVSALYEKTYMDFESVGGEMIAGAATGAANLSQSLRQTAAMDIGDFSTLLGMIALIIPEFLKCWDLTSCQG